MLRRLAALSLAERRRLPALEPGRADVLVGGAAVLAEAMAVLGTEELVASESDILDGIAASLVA
jgi:exopolyphosphatase/guanosine-5'-triphosphate,3'-diphosphate pyrophosphatase